MGLPTDTIYGLGVAISALGGTAALFTLKERPTEVALPVLVGSLEQALTLCQEPSAKVRRLMDAFWPGPLTIVLARRAGLDVDLGGRGDTIGVRLPAHPVPVALARRAGPLAVSSANRHGQPTPADAAGVAAAFGADLALVLDAGPAAAGASTVVDGTGDELSVLREGPITAERLASIALR